MDSFGKAVKAGLVKAYAVGQQQVQQHIGRRTNQEQVNYQHSAPASNACYQPSTYVPAEQTYSQYPIAPQNVNTQQAYPPASNLTHAENMNATPYFPPPPPPPPPTHSSHHPEDLGHYSTIPASGGETYTGAFAGEQTSQRNSTAHSATFANDASRPSTYHPPSSSSYTCTQGNLTQETASTAAYSFPGQPSHTRPAPQTLAPGYSTPPVLHTTAATSSSYYSEPPVKNSKSQLAAGASAAVPQQGFLNSQQVGAPPDSAYTHSPHLSASQISRHSNAPLGPSSSKEQRNFNDARLPPSQHLAPPDTPSGDALKSNHASIPAPDEGGLRDVEGFNPKEEHYTSAQDAAGLSDQMATLNFRTEIPREPPQNAYSMLPFTRGQRLPPMRATGTPYDVVRFCPEDRIVNYSLYWYFHADLPEYLICSKCHAEHIEGTSLAAKFLRVKRPDGSASSCGFWVPRIKETLWPFAIRTNSTENLLAFMKKRLNIASCKGLVYVTGAEKIKWFGMTANDIDGFVACEVCYEDHVVGTAFEARFGPYMEQGEDDKWMCDMCVPYITHAMSEMSKLNDWPGFIRGAAQRLQLPACEGKEVPSGSLKWYRPRRKIENLHICETCYMDKLAMTMFEAEFRQDSPSSGFKDIVEQVSQNRTCKLSGSAISMLFALENATHQRDFTVFSIAARTICGLVPCTANGIIRGNWWTLTGGCDGFSVCEACHTGILRTCGVDMFFEPVQRDREATIVCNFCVAGPRFVQFLNKYAEALDKGVFSCYAVYVKKFASVQACPGIKHREKAKWWGYPEALFCEECFLSFVEDTPLAKTLAIHAEYDDRAQICQIWSPRMRTIFLEACEAGPLGSPESKAALDGFRAFGAHRLQVYLQTVPRIEFVLKMQQIKMVSAMHQGSLSLMYQGMNSRAVLSGTGDGYWHGNSSLGWYETEFGATGAQMFKNMQAGMANANRPEEWMQIAQMSAMWNEVE